MTGFLMLPAGNLTTARAAKKAYTTPKVLRGTWYFQFEYRLNHKIRLDKMVITKHSIRHSDPDMNLAYGAKRVAVSKLKSGHHTYYSIARKGKAMGSFNIRSAYKRIQNKKRHILILPTNGGFQAYYTHFKPHYSFTYRGNINQGFRE